MPLPVSGSLSLAEAGQFVVDATGAGQHSVAAALKEDGITGSISATGCLHSSALPNLAQYFAHPVLGDRQTVPAAAWRGPIDWRLSRIGRYDQVRIDRAEIERWLATATPEPADIARTGEEVAAAAPEPERSDNASESTVNYLALKAAIEQHGAGTEAQLTAHAALAFPGKHVPRAWVRRARDDLFGKPSPGRPKSADKSPA